jgi:hypothetical protein
MEPWENEELDKRKVEKQNAYEGDLPVKEDGKTSTHFWSHSFRTQDLDDF